MDQVCHMDTGVRDGVNQRYSRAGKVGHRRLMREKDGRRRYPRQGLVQEQEETATGEPQPTQSSSYTVIQMI